MDESQKKSLKAFGKLTTIKDHTIQTAVFVSGRTHYKKKDIARTNVILGKFTKKPIKKLFFNTYFIATAMVVRPRQVWNLVKYSIQRKEKLPKKQFLVVQPDEEIFWGMLETRAILVNITVSMLSLIMIKKSIFAENCIWFFTLVLKKVFFYSIHKCVKKALHVFAEKKPIYRLFTVHRNNFVYTCDAKEIWRTIKQPLKTYYIRLNVARTW